MSACDQASLTHSIARLIGGTADANEAHKAMEGLKRRVAKIAPDLVASGLDDDVVQRTLEVLLRGGRFRAVEGSEYYLERTVQTAARDVRAESGPPGPRHPWRDEDGELCWAQPTRSLDEPLDAEDQTTSLGDTLLDRSDPIGNVESGMVAAEVIKISGRLAPALIALIEEDLPLGSAALRAGVDRFKLYRGLQDLAVNEAVAEALLAA